MKKNLSVVLLLLAIVACNTNTGVNEVPKHKKPLNIILLIGDGMGLSQVSSAFYYKEGTINISRFKNIGLFTNSSSSHKITDSAAGATAFSCGKKSGRS